MNKFSTIRVDTDTAAQIAALAKSTKRTRVGVIRWLLDLYDRDSLKFRGHEGVADVGLVASHPQSTTPEQATNIRPEPGEDGLQAA